MREWEQTGNIRVQSVSDSEQAEAAIEDAWSAWEAGAKASSDYVDVAEGYVRTRTFAERMRRPRQGRRQRTVRAPRRREDGRPARDRPR